MIPSLGRIVHFVDTDGEHHAAIISHVPERLADDLGVNLTVFWPQGPRATEYFVPFSKGGTAIATWHWPERETS